MWEQSQFTWLAKLASSPLSKPSRPPSFKAPSTLSHLTIMAPRSACLAGAIALLACLLLAARPAAAMDPRICMPGDWEKIFAVEETKTTPFRITNKFAARVNHETVNLVVPRMHAAGVVPKSCTLASWDAVEGCFNPATEGSNRFPSRGDYGFRFFLNFACADAKTSYQVWAYPDALRSGKITKLDFNFAKLTPGWN